MSGLSPRTVRNLKKEFRRSTLAKVGIVLVVGIILIAIFSPFVALHNPTEQRLEQAQLPPLGFSQTVDQTTSETVDGEIQTVTETTQINAQPEFPLGTDQLGRDMFSRVVYGARTSLIVGVLGTILAAAIGVPVGLIAGYNRGRIDDD
jgi:ABC-type dipeptide/oligopeptide/nickel transport systems, permease components